MPDGTMVDWNWDNLTKVAKLLTIDSAGKHSGEAGFDATKVVQYGFSFQWEGHANIGAPSCPTAASSWSPVVPRAAMLPSSRKSGRPPGKWVYDGMWGAEPYIPTGAVEGGADFDSGNSFASGKIGMVDMPSWYLCCVGDLIKAGGKFDFGAMPISLDGKVAGRTDADTFRIWKGTKHPAEAFTVLAYLIDTGINKLVVGYARASPCLRRHPQPVRSARTLARLPRKPPSRS